MKRIYYERKVRSKNSKILGVEVAAYVTGTSYSIQAKLIHVKAWWGAEAKYGKFITFTGDKPDTVVIRQAIKIFDKFIAEQAKL